MKSRGIICMVLLLLCADRTTSFGHNPFLERILDIGNNYVGRIADAVLKSAKNAVSSCAGVTAEVASKVADHTFKVLRWKRSAELDFDNAINSIRNVADDYQIVEKSLQTKFQIIFTGCVHTFRQGFQAANSDLIASVLLLAVRASPEVKKFTDTFLVQVIALSNDFIEGIEGCVHEAELLAERNVNNFASTVAKVPNTVSQDLSTIENCYTCASGQPYGITDPYITCAGGAVENMISRVKKDVVSVGLNLPTTAFGFANIGCKVSMCVTDKLYTAKSRIATLALELGQIYNGNSNTNTKNNNIINSE